MSDAINPSHYRTHPSGVEAIQVCEGLGYNAGNAIKYLWRAGKKGDAREDLAKAAWYLSRANARNEQVHYGSELEVLFDRVLSCEASPLTRVLEALVGKTHHHPCKPRDIQRAIAVLDEEIARMKRERDLRPSEPGVAT
jgi:hypothetical protein